MYNLTRGGGVTNELFADFERYNSTTTFVAYAPIVGTMLTGLFVFKIMNISNHWSIYWCQSGNCTSGSPGSPTGGGGATPCTPTATYTTGWAGWGFQLNQCAWQQIYTDLCTGVGFSGEGAIEVLALIAIIASGEASALAAAIFGMNCIDLLALSDDSSGATIFGWSASWCYWQWSWPWNWNWVCAVSTVVLGFTPGGPPSGF